MNTTTELSPRQKHRERIARCRELIQREFPAHVAEVLAEEAEISLEEAEAIYEETKELLREQAERPVEEARAEMLDFLVQMKNKPKAKDSVMLAAARAIILLLALRVGAKRPTAPRNQKSILRVMADNDAERASRKRPAQPEVETRTCQADRPPAEHAPRKAEPATQRNEPPPHDREQTIWTSSREVEPTAGWRTPTLKEIEDWTGGQPLSDEDRAELRQAHPLAVDRDPKQPTLAELSEEEFRQIVDNEVKIDPLALSDEELIAVITGDRNAGADGELPIAEMEKLAENDPKLREMLDEYKALNSARAKREQAAAKRPAQHPPRETKPTPHNEQRPSDREQPRPRDDEQDGPPSVQADSGSAKPRGAAQTGTATPPNATDKPRSQDNPRSTELPKRSPLDQTQPSASEGPVTECRGLAESWWKLCGPAWQWLWLVWQWVVWQWVVSKYEIRTSRAVAQAGSTIEATARDWLRSISTAVARTLRPTTSGPRWFYLRPG